MRKESIICVAILFFLFFTAALVSGKGVVERNPIEIRVSEKDDALNSIHNSIAEFIIERGFDAYQVEYVSANHYSSMENIIAGKTDVDITWSSAYLPDELIKALEEGQVLDLGESVPGASQGWWIPAYMISEESTSEESTSDATASEATTSDATASEATTSEATTSEATTSDATASEATTSDATASEEPASDQPENEEPVAAPPETEISALESAVTVGNLPKLFYPQFREVFENGELPEESFLKEVLYAGSQGWTALEYSESIFETEELGRFFEQVVSQSGAEHALSLLEAYQQERPWIGYYWSPSILFGSLDMVEVQGTDFPPISIRSLVHENLREKAPELVEFFDKFSISTKNSSELLAVMDETGWDSERVARWFLQNKTEIWTSWIGKDREDMVKAAL
ncbi:MAG: hypothetical protein K9L75_04890 [Spirochaetia bacterium]|nr:hypothetical protein [Spirochaetia bacterium]